MPTTQQRNLLLLPPHIVVASSLILDYTDIAGSYLLAEAFREAYANHDPVSSITDFSGQGNTMVQAVGAAQPEFLTGEQNGRPAFAFNGAKFVLKISATGIGAGAFTGLFVVKRAGSGARRTLFYAGQSANAGRQVCIDTSEKLRLTESQIVEVAPSTSNVSNSAYQAWLVNYDGTTYNFYLNNVLDATGSNAQSFTDTTPIVMMGQNASGGELMNGNIALAVAWDSVLSGTDIERVFARANADYALY